MGPLNLDFRSAPRPRPLGWALLFLGLAAPAGLLAVHRQWQEETRELRSAVAALESRLPRRLPSRQEKEAEAALAAARNALDKARLPWDSLFTAVESADNPDVAVLALLPDGPRRQVKIHAEGRNLAAMLAYQRRLEQAGGLRQVTLVDHEAGGEAAEAAVRFHLSAAWGEDHGRP